MSLARTRTVGASPARAASPVLRLAANLGLVLFGLLLALLLGEAVIRVVAPRQLYRFPVGMFRNDALLGYSLTPGFRGVIDAEEYRTEVRINRQGLRADGVYGPKAPSTVRIVALGDSFTMAYSVDLPQTFASVLEQNLRSKSRRPVEVINAGCGGYTPRQELLFLESRGLDLEPDLVVQGFFMGNDLTGNIPREPEVGVVDGYLMSKRSSEGTLPRPLRLFLSRRSQLYNYLWPLQHALREGRKSWKPARALAKFRTDADEIPAAEWNATLDVLESMDRSARARGADFLVALFPEGLQVDPGRWESIVARFGVPGATYSPDSLHERMRHALQERGIDSVDLLPALLAANRQGTPLYYPLDGHWTAEGNRVVGEALAGYLFRSGVFAQERGS